MTEEQELRKRKKIRNKVREIRFAFIGETEEYIAGELGISEKGWYKVKTGNGNFSEKLLHKVNVLLRVHRPSPVKLFQSDASKLAHYAIKNTENIDDLEAIFGHMEGMLVNAMQGYLNSDYGFLGLCGSLAFALWMDSFEALLKYNQGQDELERQRELRKKAQKKALNFLERSILYWEKAEDAPTKGKTAPIIKDVFKINHISAKIWKETFFEEEGVFNSQGIVKKNKEYSKVFHEIAAKGSFKEIIALRVDALEQAAVCKEPALIDADWTILENLIKKIPLVDQKEVILPKLMEIDGYTEVKTRPSFKEWVSRLKMQE